MYVNLILLLCNISDDKWLTQCTSKGNLNSPHFLSSIGTGDPPKGAKETLPSDILKCANSPPKLYYRRVFKKMQPPQAKWGQDRPCSHLHLLKIYCSLYRSKLHVSGFHYYSLLVCMTNDIKIDKRLILLPLLYNYYTDIQICDSLQKNYEDDICFCLQGSMPCRL